MRQIAAQLLSNRGATTASDNMPTAYEHEVEYILYDGNEERKVFPAWELDDNNVLVQNGNNIDENYALENPVYIISLNENVDDNGKIPPPADDPILRDPPPPPAGLVLKRDPPPPPPANPTLINLKINDIGINCLNESWVAGKSDVSIRAERLTWNGKMDGQINGADGSYSSDRSTSDLRGILIRQFYRDETWNGTSLQMKTVNFNLQYNWQFVNWFSQPVIYWYVIFEKDNWPTGVQTDAGRPFLGNGISSQRFWSYRSADPSYFSGSFYVSRTGLPSTYSKPNVTFYPDNSLREVVEENSCIKFNIIQY